LKPNLTPQQQSPPLLKLPQPLQYAIVLFFSHCLMFIFSLFFFSGGTKRGGERGTRIFILISLLFSSFLETPAAPAVEEAAAAAPAEATEAHKDEVK
jgi:hypothetical protein